MIIVRKDLYDCEEIKKVHYLFTRRKKDYKTILEDFKEYIRIHNIDERQSFKIKIRENSIEWFYEANEQNTIENLSRYLSKKYINKDCSIINYFSISFYAYKFNEITSDCYIKTSTNKSKAAKSLWREREFDVRTDVPLNLLTRKELEEETFVKSVYTLYIRKVFSKDNKYAVSIYMTQIDNNLIGKICLQDNQYTTHGQNIFPEFKNIVMKAIEVLEEDFNKYNK